MFSYCQTHSFQVISVCLDGEMIFHHLFKAFLLAPFRVSFSRFPSQHVQDVREHFKTHCSEFVCGDLFLALCDGVEKQVLQAGQDARLPSPAGNKNKTHRKVRKITPQ